MNTIHRLTFWPMLLITALALIMGLSTQPALAADFNPGCTGGVGDTAALAAAITTANSNGVPDTINLAAGCTYTLTSQLSVQADGGNLLTINGNGATLDGNNSVRHMKINTGSIVNINNITLTNGNQPTGSSEAGSGGSIYNQGVLSISNSVISNNAAHNVAGIYNQGNGTVLNINDSLITGNTALSGPGALRNYLGATLNITNTTISNNTSGPQHGGAAISNTSAFDTDGTTVTIANSTLANNTGGGTGSGGAIYTFSASLHITNSTIVGNQAGDDGGGIFAYLSGTTTASVINSTITGNSAGDDAGGIFASANAAIYLQIKNTIVAGNSAYSGGADLGGWFNSQGYNLIGSTHQASFVGDTSTNITNTSPELGPFQNNGGSTWTVALSPLSPAVDAGSCDAGTDQRGAGFSRPHDFAGYANASGGNGCDIGAYEAHSLTLYAKDTNFTTPYATMLNVPAPGVLGQAVEPDGLSLTASLLSGPTFGDLVLNPNGSFSYTPSGAFFGNDSFTYDVSNGSGSVQATATINVAAPPRPGGVVSATNNANIPIPDPSGGFCGINGSVVNIANAPADALVTRVEYSTRIVHTWAGDIQYIEIVNSQGAEIGVMSGNIHPSWQTDRGRDDDPEDDSDIDLRRRVFEYDFDGYLANQQWALVAQDCLLQDTGYIDSFSIWVHYVPVYDAPTVVEPSGTTTDHYGSPDIVWLNTAGSVYYQVGLFNAANNTTVFYEPELAAADYCSGDTCTLDPTTLNENYRLTTGNYQIWLRALNASKHHTVNWSGPFSFTLQADPPALPTVGAIDNPMSETPTFNWTLDEPGADYASWFQIAVHPVDPAGTYQAAALSVWRKRADVCGTSDGTTCSFTVVDPLPAATRYGLFIRSWGPGGFNLGDNTAYTAPVFFNVGGDPPLVPQNFIVNAGHRTSTFTWDDDANAEWFHLMIEKGGQTVFNKWYQRDVSITCSEGTCSITHELTLTNGTYTAKVRAYGPGGFSVSPETSGFTAPVEFILGPPPVVTTFHPVTEDAGVPTLSWDGVETAEWYQVWLGTHDVNATPQWGTIFSGWRKAVDLGLECATLLGPCTLVVPLDPGLADGAYVYFVQVWGPGGYNAGSSTTWSARQDFIVPVVEP